MAVSRVPARVRAVTARVHAYTHGRADVRFRRAGPLIPVRMHKYARNDVVCLLLLRAAYGAVRGTYMVRYT